MLRVFAHFSSLSKLKLFLFIIGIKRDKYRKKTQFAN
ncbi:hypothetical protein BACUNI_00763 [Bacteroides uniformis ATCC 8492]|uniref:Uncharacterized protein n=1 Tax=Bacteroides uniformis (strain ATCC 8492 / DSM 6597 / CCUG 4942 / CIP 103695 / JCM 5828 / KCTC 5204 / NCTC 13054 / VPI 0061) TaxID=411479 RepID=A0ABC9NFC9_BACUC|nr:hypothetical protein BACUNI_00763 [Bacteroides uniformis ATCC 8492]